MFIIIICVYIYIYATAVQALITAIGTGPSNGWGVMPRLVSKNISSRATHYILYLASLGSWGFRSKPKSYPEKTNFIT